MTNSDRDPFRVDDKDHHIAMWGLRSWVEYRLRKEGLIVAKTLPLQVLEAILKRVEDGVEV